MRKILFALAAVFNFWTLVIHSAEVKSKSVYQDRLSDSTAVYFTPANFNITADGKTDVSDALQNAICNLKATRDCGIIFIPEGKYRIGKTIYIPVGIRLIGYGKSRPVMVLSKNTPGFQKKDSIPQYNYLFWFVSDYNPTTHQITDANASTFYSAFSNIDVAIEDGNTNAVAFRTHYAQNSFLSHVDIHINSGVAGIYEIGNEIEDVRFFGGEYGIMATKTSPGWQYVMMDTYFEGQRKVAVKTEDAGLTIIRMTARNMPVVIDINPDKTEKLFLQDSQFDNIGTSALNISNELNPLNQISIRNVDCRKTPFFMTFRRNGKQIPGNGLIYKVKNLISGLQIDSPGKDSRIRTTHEIVGLKSFPTPTPTDIPSFPETQTWVNIKSLGAKGDGLTDDYPIIRDAIEKYQTIYFPQGWYRVSEPIRLKLNTVFIGLHPVSTQLILANNTQAFAGFGEPRALLETSEGGTNIFSGIGLNTNIDNPRAVACKWMAGADSYMNDVKIVGGHGALLNTPNGLLKEIPDRSPRGMAGDENTWDSQYWSLWITNGGGGTFKDIWSAHTCATSGLYVSDTQTSGRMYLFSAEHHVRNEVRFKNVSNWQVHALQLEEEGRESWNCQPLEIEGCNNVLFTNLFMYRVSRVINPYPQGIRTWNSSNIKFLNVHNFSQTRLAFDNSLYDMNSMVEVREREFTSLNLKEITTVKRDQNSDGVMKLASGFEFANGLCHDSNGNVYFCDTRWKRVFKWSAQTGSLSLVCDFPWEPLSLGCDKNDNLLVVFKYIPKKGFPYNGKAELNVTAKDDGFAFSGWGIPRYSVLAYAINPARAEESIRLLKKMPMDSVKNIHKALYPVYRQSFQSNSVKECYLAPDQETIIPICNEMSRASAMIEAFPGKPLLILDDNMKRIVKCDVSPSGRLSNASSFVETGEYGIAEGPDDKIYITDGEINVFDKEGKPTGKIKVPERPTNLSFGGKDGKTLFIVAGKSLYSFEIHN